MDVTHAVKPDLSLPAFQQRVWPTVALLLTLPLLSASANIRELTVAGAAIDQQRVESAQLSNGWIAFTWEDQSGADSEVKYRLFDAANSTFTSIQTANAVLAGDQVDPVISPLGNGGFAIAFASRQVGGQYDVKLRRFDSTGTALDVGDLAVNAIIAGAQQHPSITTLDDGSLVIAFSGPGTTGQDLFFRKFAADGTPSGAAETQLNDYGGNPITAGDQADVRVDTFPEGGWMATFEDRAAGEVYGIRFDNSGTSYADPLNGPNSPYFLLNATTANNQLTPALAAFGDEEFATAFTTETDGTAAGRRVRLRIFNSGGPVTGDLAVGAAHLRSQDPDIAWIPGPNLVVAWQSQEVIAGLPVWSIYTQVFSLTGTSQGSPLLLHTSQSVNRGRPKVIPWLDGGYSVVWEAGGAGGNVAARTVAPTTVSPGSMGVALTGTPGAQSYHVSFLGFPGECYELQAADALSNWSTILTTNAPAGSFQYVDPDGAVTPQRFFQVKRKLTGL